MVNLQKLDTIAVICMSILGLVFFIMSISVFKNLDASCPSSMLRDGCYTEIETTRTTEVYLGIFGVFSLVIVGLCAGMLKQYGDLSDDDKNECDDDSNTTKRLTTFVTIMASLGVVFTVSMLIKTHLEENSLLAALK